MGCHVVTYLTAVVETAPSPPRFQKQKEDLGFHGGFFAFGPRTTKSLVSEKGFT